ncbi:phage terminase [Pseudonocardia dioxanivorans] [Mycobacterium shimoidei]|uniref:Phage terminase [Pseudonocardia dioxanivorans] n=1 Tax=Mycobacterium shimoidei TaxID=29313 RepID=A0A375YXD0_MYCSH|nr:hypothetical protein [Mycobacterium shimoidei]SRX93571.1 phage terminase [Pseudonocardia dioxanivorans] [Mycobacterium shimoidei]
MTQSVEPLVEPAYANFPQWSETYGPEVADLCDLAGFPPDPEQEMALNALFGIDSNGRSVAFEFAAIAPRQNLKTGLAKQAILGWVYITEQRLITMSAHDMTPTLETFNDLVNLIENCRPLAKRLADGPSNGIFRGPGKEAIAFKPSPACPDGQRIKFKARTYSGGRGLTANKVILDEAFALRKSHMGSLMPTLSAVPDPQLFYGSSACHADSEVLHKIVERGRSHDPAKRKRLGYLEFCAPEDACEDPDCPHHVGYPGCAMDKREYIIMANPQAGRRITWEYLEGERDGLDPAEFGRERMGWHDKLMVDEDPAISKELWKSLADPNSTPVDPVAFGVYINKDRTNCAIGVAAYREDRLIHVGVVPAVHGGTAESLPGTAWIPGRVKELVDRWKPCAVVIDDHSAAASLITKIQELGVEVVTTNAGDMAKACGNFYDAATDKAIGPDGKPGRLRHQGAQSLQLAVTSGKRRDLSDAWAWDRKDKSSDITQLVAVTLALHGLLEHQPQEIEVWGFFT